jgi:NTE family protein
MDLDTSQRASVPGLVLTGGGARAAYQVGVLKAVAELFPDQPNPFRVIVGTSAGAVAAAVIASRARRWQRAVQAIEHVWAGFHVDQVFDVGAGRMFASGLHWMASLATGGLVVPPRSLFRNAPLRDLLLRNVSWQGLRNAISRGDVDALALCATSYSNAQSVAFFEGGAQLQEWTRRLHVGRRTTLSLEHLMGSLSVPFLFPPERIGNDFHGDGAMRQIAPLSPAVHLGAGRLFVVGVRAAQEHHPGLPAGKRLSAPRPGQLLGYALDTLFTDNVYADREQIARMNQLVEAAPQLVPGARRVDTLLLTPSEDPREIAARHIGSLPRSLRALLGVAGVRDARGSRLASYLMFEADYTQELIALGYKDAMGRSGEIRDFLAPPR